MQNLRGTWAPIPTPLTDEGEFDEGALARHLAWLGSQGLDGALILGTNGEFPSFSLAERRTIARAAVAHRGSLRLLLNIGSCALPEALALLELAADGGYDALLCPPPFYFRTAPVEGLADFFRQLLDASTLPVLLYHVPQVCGVAITDELLDALGAHPQLAGVKDSSGSESELVRLRAHFSGRAYLVGNDSLVAACLANGGSGSISAAASVAPALVKAVDRSGQLQPLLTDVRASLEASGLGASVKALLRHYRLGAYGSRPPMRPLSSAATRQLIARFDQLAADYAPRR